MTNDLKPARITPFAPAGRPTVTRMENGELRSAVHTRMDSEFTLAGASEPFAAFERVVEGYQNDIKLPDRYREQLIADAETKVYEDIERVWIADMDTQFAQIKQDKAQLEQDRRQDVPSPAVLVDFAVIDRTDEISALRNMAKDLIARGDIPRARRVLPQLVKRGTTLAARTNDIGEKQDAVALRALADGWHRANPELADREEAIRARETRVLPDSTAKFHRSLNIFGVKPR